METPKLVEPDPAHKKAALTPLFRSVPLAFIAGIGVGALGLYLVDRGLAVSKNPVPAVADAKPAAREQSGVLLMPGEQLVLAPEPPATQIPKPAPPQPVVEPPKPASPVPSPVPHPARTRPPVIAQENARPAPPQYSREERRDSFARSVCLNCGVVTSVTRGDYDWEVRVRMDDGSRQTLRYYDRPRVQTGDTFHLEEGRLVSD